MVIEKIEVKVMTKSPQTNYFKKANQCEQIEKILSYLLALLTMLSSFMRLDLFFINGLFILMFILIAVLHRMGDEAKYNAEKIRRMDFIDHSFNTKYIEDSSEKYYDNDEIEHGFYKMVVNNFENSLFSSEISKKMYEKKQFNLLILSSLLLIGFILGIINMKNLVPIIQLMLSGYFYVSYLDLKEYKERTEQTFLDFKRLFDNEFLNTEQSIKKNMAEIIRLHIIYETNISDKKLSLDSKIYEEMNEMLTEKWETMKIKYEIK